MLHHQHQHQDTEDIQVEVAENKSLSLKHIPQGQELEKAKLEVDEENIPIGYVIEKRTKEELMIKEASNRINPLHIEQFYVLTANNTAKMKKMHKSCGLIQNKARIQNDNRHTSAVFSTAGKPIGYKTTFGLSDSQKLREMTLQDVEIQSNGKCKKVSKMNVVLDDDGEVIYKANKIGNYDPFGHKIILDKNSLYLLEDEVDQAKERKIVKIRLYFVLHYMTLKRIYLVPPAWMMLSGTRPRPLT